MLTTLLLLACSGSDPEVEPTSDPDQPRVPPEIQCPEGTTLQTATSAKGEERWCDRSGVMHGPYVQYYPGGTQRAAKGAYAENVPDGDWTEWHPNGERRSQGKYLKGKQAGSWTWWHPNSKRAEEGDYLSGRKAGQWTAWYESGLKKEEGIYHNGIKNGSWTYYNDDPENSVQRTENWVLGELKETKDGKAPPKR